MFEDKIQELQSRLAVEMEIKTGLSEKVAAYEEIVAVSLHCFSFVITDLLNPMI